MKDSNQSTGKCCFRCRDSYDSNGMPFCNNPACKCHKSTPTQDDKCPHGSSNCNLCHPIQEKVALNLVDENNVAHPTEFAGIIKTTFGKLHKEKPTREGEVD